MESGVGLATEFLVPVVFFLFEVRLLDFRLGLVEAVDDGVLARGDDDALDEARVLERYLADVHGAVLFEIGPWRVDDGDLVFFVAFFHQVSEEIWKLGSESRYLRWSWPW